MNTCSLRDAISWLRWSGAALLLAAGPLAARADCVHSAHAPGGLLQNTDRKVSRIQFETHAERSESVTIRHTLVNPRPVELPCLHCGSRHQRLPLPVIVAAAPVDAALLSSEVRLVPPFQSDPGEEVLLYTFVLVTSIEHPPR